jgi:hypothetical protein
VGRITSEKHIDTNITELADELLFEESGIIEILTTKFFKSLQKHQHPSTIQKIMTLEVLHLNLRQIGIPD